MSSIRVIDFSEVDDLVNFIRGAGYVLDFSDASFAMFFATELDVDICDLNYADFGGSKGKRLRCFLQKVDNPAATRALNALWEHRASFLQKTGRVDPVINAEARYLALLSRLNGGSADHVGMQEQPRPAFDHIQRAALSKDLVQLSSLQPQARGYAFEAFLKLAFDLYGLAAREPFRNCGEQIDGSFMLAKETYLLEAKWQNAPTGAADLHGFHGKLEQKAVWARGLFISHSGFTEGGLHAFGSGKRIICMDGEDLYEVLRRGLPLDQVLERKVRRAAETGLPFTRVRDIFPA